MSTKSELSEAFEYAKQYGGTDYYNYIGSPEYWDDLRHKQYITDLTAKEEYERRKQEQQYEFEIKSFKSILPYLNLWPNTFLHSK